MTDDAERAAKAARAKALLKKRQQQKAGVSPSPSPAPGAAHGHGHEILKSPPHKDAALLFGEHESGKGIDFGEFGVLTEKNIVSPAPRGTFSPQPQTFSPPPAQSPGSTPTSPSNGDASSEQLGTLVKTQQQTISLLVSEKASLIAELDRLEGLEARFNENENLAGEQRRRAEALVGRVKILEEQAKVAADRLDHVAQRERESTEKLREQDREIELVRRTAGDFKAQLETRERELRALREQLEKDDRVDELERSLKGTQDRAEELEFQLAKVKQSHASAMRERETLGGHIRSLTTSESDWKTRHATLEQDTLSTRNELASLSSSLDGAERARSHLEAQLSISETALTSAQQQLAHMAPEFAFHVRQLQVAQSDVANAQKRASDAEHAQRSLQAENSGLLAQLEEVRPKVVELSNKVAEDEERIWEATKRSRVLETEVSRLERQMEESTQAAKEDLQELEERLHMERLREADRHEYDLKEVQGAYAKVSSDLDHADRRVHQLGQESDEYRATIHASERDRDHWKAQAEAREADLAAIKNELGDGRKAEDDALAIVRSTQAEIEELRDQLALREDELARLRDGIATSRSSSPRRSTIDGSVSRPGQEQNLNEEMLSAMRTQHALDISTAHSRIRELETEVFDTQARAHSFQRRVTALEDEMALLRANALSPPPFLRGSSFYSPGGGSEDRDSRRHSLSSSRPHTPSNLSRSLLAPRTVYDANLSVETRHKRKVSLSMLKARIESERAAVQHTAAVTGSPKPALTSGLSGFSVAIAEVDESGAQTPQKTSEGRPSLSHSRVSNGVVGTTAKRLPSFLDESHVFWCHSCRGDLVVL